MSTALRIGPYPLFSYSLENQEPAHIQVEAAARVARFGLSPVELAANHGFRSHELTTLRKLVLEHRATLEEAWYIHCRR